MTVQEASDVLFRCQSNADPDVTVIWKKKGGQIPPGRSVCVCTGTNGINNNNNNNNIVICKAHKVSSNAESEAPAVTSLVDYAKRTVLRRRLKVSAVGESLVSRGKSFQTVGAR